MQYREIDLLDLVFEIIGKWKMILLLVLVGALAGGAYGGVKYRSALQEYEQKVQLVQEESYWESLLTATEQVNVQQVVENEQLLAVQREVTENSILLQMDPNAVEKTELAYYISTNMPADGLRTVYEYTTALNDADFWAAMTEVTGDTEVQLKELITVSNSNIINEEYLEEDIESVSAYELKIVILYPDEAGCTALADAIDAYIQDESAKISRDHTINLTRRLQVTGYEESVATKQATQTKSMQTLKTGIAALVDKFTTNQNNYYKVLQGEAVAVSGVSASPVIVKNIVLTVLLLEILYVMGLCCKYIMDSHIQPSFNVMRQLKIMELGRILCTDADNKKNVLEQWISKKRFYGSSKAHAADDMSMLTNTVVLLAHKEGIESLVLFSSNQDADANQVAFSLAQELKKEKISAKVVGNIAYDSDSVKELDGASAGIMIEKVGSARYPDIRTELQLAEKLGITILGGILVG